MKSLFLSLVLISVSVVSNAAVFPVDSVYTDKNTRKSYIIHKVKADETLYSLLKKYHCENKDFQMANPEMNGGSTIYLGQNLRFPIASNPKETKNAGATKSASHTVAANETLYSISKKYEVNLDQLKSINGLADNNVKVGQKLILPSKTEENTKKEPTKIDEKVPNAPTGKKVVERGVAELIQTKRFSNKMLAMHRTAPVGTQLYVRNTATGQGIVVKVIGKLPDTGNNENIMLRLSPSAFYQLSPNDIKISAEVEYVMPPNQ